MVGANMKEGVLEEISQATDPEAFKGQWIEIGEGTQCRVTGLLRMADLLRTTPLTVLALGLMGAVPYTICKKGPPKKRRRGYPMYQPPTPKPVYIDFYPDEMDFPDPEPVPAWIDPAGQPRDLRMEEVGKPVGGRMNPAEGGRDGAAV